MRGLKNRLRLFCDYKFRKAEVKSYPVEYVVEVSSLCDLDCPMCPSTMKNKAQRKGLMKRETFQWIIQRIKSYAELVLLIGAGEPLLNPYFIEFVGICKRQGIKVGTSTNCVRLTRDMSRRIIESGLDYIIFPVEGTNKADYESIRVGTNFEDIVENINVFLSLKKQLSSKIYISVQGLVGEEMPMDYKDYRESIIELFKDNYKAINEIRLKPLIDYNGTEYWHSKPCLLLWRNAYIDFKGDVLSCCQDQCAIYVLGNLLYEDLLDIWNSVKMKHLRKMNFNPQTMNGLETCKHCGLKMDEYSSILPLLGATLLSPYLSRKFVAMYEKYFMLRDRKLLRPIK